MAKAESYIKDIEAQVRADHNGVVPEHLNLTIRNYASVLETRDMYRDQILKEGATKIEVGSTGQQTTKQHPLCALLYQQEILCLNYARHWVVRLQRRHRNPKMPTAGNQPTNSTSSWKQPKDKQLWKN